MADTPARPSQPLPEPPQRGIRPPEERTLPPKPRAKKDRRLGATSHEDGMTRLVFNVGIKHDVRPGDIVGVVAGVTRLGKEVIGAIHLLPKQTLVDVATDHEAEVREKLNGIKFKGRKLFVEPADTRQT